MRYSTNMEDGGLVTLPADWLEELGLKDGDWIALDSDGQEIRLSKSDYKGDASVLKK